MGKVQVRPAYPKGLDFEQVWAALMENREQLRETDKLLKASIKENDRRTEEYNKRADEFNKRFGDFTNRFGEVVEYMIAPNLLEKFREAGLSFTQAGPDRVFTEGNDISFEVDVLLENGDKAMLVEVKTKLTTEDVKDHIKRLGKMRAYADLHGDKRTFLGAVAGVVMTAQVKKFALEHGFYVVEPSGKTFNITPPQGKPKEW